MSLADFSFQIFQSMAIAVSKMHEVGIAHNDISAKMFKASESAAFAHALDFLFTKPACRYSPSNSLAFQTTNFASSL